MKRPVVAVLAVACAAALGTPALEAGVGVKVGFSLARIHQTSPEPLLFARDDSRFLAGGLSFERGLMLLSLQAEVLYVRMGGKDTIDSANGLEYRFHYIQAPVMLKFDIVPFGPLRPFVGAGAYGSLLVKAESVMTAGGDTTRANLTKDYERYDYGIVGGAGLALKLPGISLSVEGRYDYGLRNILKNPVPGAAVKNRCLIVLAGISY